MLSRIRIHPSFLLVWVFFLLSDKTVFVLYMFLAAAIHEAAHICAYMSYGAAVEKLDILPFGLSAKIRCADRLDCSKEIICASAGIIANILFAAALVPVVNCTQLEGTFYLMSCSLAFAAINLLPIFPLDGGRIIYFMMLSKLPPLKAEKLSYLISYIFLIPLFVLSVWLITVSMYNFSLLMITFYLFFYLLFKKPS